ncbi:MAG: aldo/keto reductase [Pseudomonadota bacterium]
MTQLWHDLPPLGMGCWAIGGPFSGGGRPLGWGATDDTVSRAALTAAYEAGVRIFDTAQAYGTGHSETLLGDALARHTDARFVTKVGYRIDPAKRELTGEITEPAEIRESLDASRRRLGRDVIDLVLLHPNEAPLATAAPIFDALDEECAQGRVGAYGWSTDFPDNARAFATRDGFLAVEHAMNVLFAAPHMVPATQTLGLTALIRSPLAMGLLAGRITKETTFGDADVRSTNQGWLGFFEDGRPKPVVFERLAAIRDALGTGGRTLAQGALGWLWARHPAAIPIPGMRTPAQVADLVGALEYGPLPRDAVDHIETLIDRTGEDDIRSR